MGSSQIKHAFWGQSHLARVTKLYRPPIKSVALKIKTLKKVGPVPGFICLYYGGSDLGKLSARKLRIVLVLHNTCNIRAINIATLLK